MIAEELIRDSLQEIGQQAAEQPVQADELQTGIRYTNRIMRGVDYLGLGFTVLTSGSQEVTIPAYAEEWVVYKLAIRLAAQFPTTDQLPVIMQNEKEAWNNLLIQHITIPETSYPDTMPVGSGNQYSIYPDVIFYPLPDDAILAEDGGNILLED